MGRHCSAQSWCRGPGRGIGASALADLPRRGAGPHREGRKRMFSKLRKRLGSRNRFGVPGVLSVIALVFAMTGGAFAAKYVITSTKQIKPSVLKALKGKVGPPGAQGPAGPAGAQGPAGPAGAAGAQGEPGAAGTTGPKGATGTTGTTGTTGATGATGATGFSGFTETLPSGKTETGAWSVTVAALGGAFAALPFPIPLASELENTKVHIAPEPTNCPGTAAEPKANIGHLCVYVNGGGFIGGPATPEAVLKAASGAAGASKTGAVLLVEGSEAIGFGTYAVTAP